MNQLPRWIWPAAIIGLLAIVYFLTKPMTSDDNIVETTTHVEQEGNRTTTITTTTSEPATAETTSAATPVAPVANAPANAPANAANTPAAPAENKPGRPGPTPTPGQSQSVNGVAFVMKQVKGGTYTMGCTGEQGADCASNEKPSHSVTLNDFSIGETEVTQALWTAVMGKNAAHLSFPGCAECPVETVSWNDVQEFFKKLNQLLPGHNYRLPSETEWEYAARGGAKTKGTKYAGSNSLVEVGWWVDNSDNKTHPVKSKMANELGLYDMSGNVWEWCQDWYDSGFYKTSPSNNPVNTKEGKDKVCRGGSWGYIENGLRVSYRTNYSPTYKRGHLGFRIAE